MMPNSLNLVSTKMKRAFEGRTDVVRCLRHLLAARVTSNSLICFCVGLSSNNDRSTIAYGIASDFVA
ncbi:hypothetical protein A4A49_21768 [Nicotiana attenuata]|uniref:Uncharacterized protein n=1 Tax=Nicotiana attenuata TaxID=49451 RepID=A0A1J6J5P5_NICAT|nr:hypothetical protein A4A49_21768 [Nicotiana attenuata]